MARTDISVTDQPNQGSTVLTFSAADATNDMKFANDGNTILVVKVGATQTQITVQGVPDEAGRDGTEQVTTTSNTVVFGPFAERWWNAEDGSGEVWVDFDQDTDVTVAALRLKS